MPTTQEEYDLLLRKCLCGCGDENDFERLELLEEKLGIEKDK